MAITQKHDAALKLEALEFEDASLIWSVSHFVSTLAEPGLSALILYCYAWYSTEY